MQRFYLSKFSLERGHVDSLPIPACEDATRYTHSTGSTLGSIGLPVGNPARHTTCCVLRVRALLQQNLNLPTEIISIILDHAAYWVSAVTTAHMISDTEPIWRDHKLITTSSLGRYMTSYDTESKNASLRGLCPCRQITVTMRAQSVQRPVTYNPSPHIKRMHWRKKPPGRHPITMNVEWATPDAETERFLQRRPRDQVFSVWNFPSVLDNHGGSWPRDGSIPEDFSMPVIENGLSQDVMEERVVTWSWTDESAGGDLVRALMVGDAVQLKAKHRVFGWGTMLSFLQVEVFYAI